MTIEEQVLFVVAVSAIMLNLAVWYRAVLEAIWEAIFFHSIAVGVFALIIVYMMVEMLVPK